jgi:hypothetical protein
MATPFEIPLSSQPQKFSIELNKVEYNISFQWCEPAKCWKLDIYDINNAAILTGIPLITGVNLLEPFPYLNFNGQLIVQTDYDLDAVPNFDNMGTNGHLYWIAE